MTFRMTVAALFAMAVLAVVAARASGPLCAQTPTPEKFRVYLGTYTENGSKGIYQCELSMKDGTLSPVELVAETESPSFLAIHPDKKHLYAVNEGKATVSAFAIDSASGKLTFLNSQPSQGGAPCHLTVDRSGRNVLAANYSGGSCLCLPIEADGKLGKASSFQQHVAPRTNGHAIHVDQANRFAFCCDLGQDKVVIYRFDAEKGTLTPHGAFSTPKGAGPRHFAWHPDGKTAYINGESDLTVIACAYNAEKGELTQTQVLSTLPADVVKKGGSTAETVVHPSGKFVYVSNRDPYNSIAIFSLDPKTKELKAVGHQAAGVKTPRNFAIEPTGRYMLVANQSGGNVLVFAIDPETGALRPTGGETKVPRPVCVRFMDLK